MSNRNNSTLAWILAAFGLAGAGFAAGLHRLVWALYFALTALWVWLIYYMYSTDEPVGDNLTYFVYWALGVGAPIVVGLILAITERIVVSIAGRNTQK